MKILLFALLAPSFAGASLIVEGSLKELFDRSDLVCRRVGGIPEPPIAAKAGTAGIEQLESDLVEIASTGKPAGSRNAMGALMRFPALRADSLQALEMPQPGWGPTPFH